MNNRVTINPLALTGESCQLLADILLSHQSDGYLLRRNKLITLCGKNIYLENDILIRKKTDNSWCYDVMDAKSCGQGKYGSAHSIVAKITISQPQDGSSTMVVERKNKRVYKLQNNAALNEFKLMGRCSHLRVRGLFPGIPSLISMKKFEGETLNTALNGDRGARQFTVPQRFKITICLLRALKIQMHDNMICHRDIKPDNIFYNAKTGEIMIFDLGVSQLIGDTSDKRSRGNATYSAPEDFISIRTGRPVNPGEIRSSVGRKSLLTVKSDIYSIARVIGLVWGDSDNIYFDKTADYQSLLSTRSATKWMSRPHLPEVMNGLSNEYMREIEGMLTRMTDVDPDARPDLMSCIEFFEQLYLDYKLENSPDEVHQITRDTHASGKACFWKLQTISKYHHLQSRISKAVADLQLNPYLSMQSLYDVLRKKFSKTYKTLALEIDQWRAEAALDMTLPASAVLADHTRDAALATLCQTLIKHIDELGDDDAAVKEFTDTLNMQSLAGVETCHDLHARVIQIVSTYLNHYHEMMSAYATYQAENNAAMIADLDHFMLTLSSYRLTLDEISQASLHMGRKLAKMPVPALAAAPDRIVDERHNVDRSGRDNDLESGGDSDVFKPAC